jgi:type IV secretion system protein VirB6
MSCAAIETGNRFLGAMLAHVDCQAQSIGAYGYGALSDPNSSVIVALTALLTIFVAWFGIRLLSGEQIGGRDLMIDVLRVGIVLTLATSWPAFRTLGYDLVMKGPGEIASSIGTATDLQSADDGIVLLTIQGTGRSTGGTERSATIGDSFRGVTLTDQQGFANGRILFLAGVIGPLAIVKIGAGLLLAIAPLMAGLLLFAGTRDLFIGWLRGLGALAIGALALTLVHSVQLAVLEPWLRDALAQRQALYFIPSAPTELTVISLVFMLASFGILALIGRVFFFSGGTGLTRLIERLKSGSCAAAPEASSRPVFASGGDAPSRAFVIAEAVSQSLRREERSDDRSRTIEQAAGGRAQAQANADARRVDEPLGSSFRGDAARRLQRRSGASERRDRVQ